MLTLTESEPFCKYLKETLEFFESTGEWTFTQMTWGGGGGGKLEYSRKTHDSQPENRYKITMIIEVEKLIAPNENRTLALQHL